MIDRILSDIQLRIEYHDRACDRAYEQRDTEQAKQHEAVADELVLLSAQIESMCKTSNIGKN